ncbi:MAG: MFS transporter [Actinomycetaceae bacterium]|nr:MFS transporter [Actinomycetaceae bacterium]
MSNEARQIPMEGMTRDKMKVAVREVPASGKHRGIFAIAAVATLGSLLFGYDTGVISGALPYMYMPLGAAGLQLTTFQEGAIGGTLLVGAALGALIGSRLSDRYGRRHNITMLAILFLIGALGTATAPNVWVMYGFRVILGFAVGGASATVPVYLAETAPKRIRGSIVAIDQLMIVTGQLLAFSMNAVINAMHGGPQIVIESDPSGNFDPGTYSYDTITALQTVKGGTMSPDQFHEFLNQLVITSGNGDAWRYMLVLCSIPAIALWIGIRLMPESSRWYVSQQRLYEAIGSLKRIRNPQVDGPLEDELMEMIDARKHELEEEAQKKGLGYVFSVPWLRKLLFVGIFLAIINQTTGVNTVMYYAPKVLEYAGMSTSASITAQVANGVMSVIGSALGIWLILRFRRRQILIADVTGVGICLLGIAATFQFAIAPHMADGTVPPTWAAFLILALMGIFMLIVQSSNGTVVWTMMGELFPADVRGVMNGTAIFCMWITNAIITWTFPPMMEALGGGLTYSIYGVLNLVVAVILFKIMPETSGKSLEQIEKDMEELYS